MKETSKYWELHTSCLLADQILPFDVYMWREGKTILWRGKSTAVTQKDIQRLADSGVETVVIGINDKDKYLEYMEPNTLELIMNSKVPIEYKSYVVRETTNKILDKLYESPTDLKTAKRLENIISPIVELILSSANMAPLRFLLERGDMEFAYAPHSARTCYYTVALASTNSRFTREVLNQFAMASLLHDIGQMLVKPEIREKLGKYTDEERSEMEKHPIYSVSLIKRAKMFEFGEPMLTAIKSHHELGDSKGYPQRTSLFKLPVEAHHLAITHTFESYTTERIHRKARKSYDVIRYMLANPKKFPLDLVRRFVQVLSQLETY
ncbi:MAG: HD-GYP domain-containing protein [Candidatus Anammoxibacter sp.]